MKIFSIFLIGLLLMAAISTAVFAKEDVLHKDYGTHAAMVKRAKDIHAQKVIRLQHPEKMAKLQKQYSKMCRDCQSCSRSHRQGLGVKNAFYKKAQLAGVYKHDCPYRHGMPESMVPVHPDAKTMSTMKCEAMANCCK